MSNGWTSQRRARQAELIKRWKPWEASTGPRTPEGKAIVASNPDKGAIREALRELARALRAQDKARREGFD